MTHLRRDFAFAVAITATGGATVTTTSAKTITKPNIVSTSKFSARTLLRRIALQKAAENSTLAGCNSRKVAEMSFSRRIALGRVALGAGRPRSPAFEDLGNDQLYAILVVVAVSISYLSEKQHCASALPQEQTRALLSS